MGKIFILSENKQIKIPEFKHYFLSLRIAQIYVNCNSLKRDENYYSSNSAVTICIIYGEILSLI